MRVIEGSIIDGSSPRHEYRRKEREGNILASEQVNRIPKKSIRIKETDANRTPLHVAGKKAVQGRLVLRETQSFSAKEKGGKDGEVSNGGFISGKSMKSATVGVKPRISE